MVLYGGNSPRMHSMHKQTMQHCSMQAKLQNIKTNKKSIKNRRMKNQTILINNIMKMMTDNDNYNDECKHLDYDAAADDDD